MSTQPPKARFAPSPTGLLHLGNVRTALFNYLWTRRVHGAFLLRIEDTDATRGHEKYAQALMHDLRWLGLAWDEGPERGGPDAPYAQSQRGEIYQGYLALLEAARRVYPCFCTEHELKVERKTQIAAGRPPRYSGKCRDLDAAEVKARYARGMTATLRFRVVDGHSVEFTDQVRGAQRYATSDIGDFVVRRSDGTPAFFFCNAVDDALMSVTLVIRGEDHLTNTPRQILLLRALNLPIPEYAHIPLVVGGDGAPLSKRTGSKSVQELREAGFLPAAINNYLARVGHTYDEQGLLALAELGEKFDLARVHHSPARYDEMQLLHWQREAVRTAAAGTLWEWMSAEVRSLVPASDREAFIDAVRANVTFPRDASHWARIVYGAELALSTAAHEAVGEPSGAFFAQALAALASHRTDFAAMTAALAADTGCKGKRLYRPLRAALTGELDGPEMAKLLPLIGVERAQNRLARWAKNENRGAR